MMRQDRFTLIPALSHVGEGAGRAALCHSERRPRPYGEPASAAKESGAGRAFGLGGKLPPHPRFLASLGMTGTALRMTGAARKTRKCQTNSRLKSGD